MVIITRSLSSSEIITTELEELNPSINRSGLKTIKLSSGEDNFKVMLCGGEVNGINEESFKKDGAELNKLLKYKMAPKNTTIKKIIKL